METLEQSVVLAAPHADCPASPTPLRGVSFVYFNHLDAPPIRLVADVAHKLPERPRIQLSVEPSPLAIFPDTLWIPDCNEGVQSLRLVNDGLGNLVQLVIRDAALLGTDSFDHLQQLLPTELPSQVEEVPPNSPQFPPVEVGLARPCVHRTCHMSDPQIHGENREVGILQLSLALYRQVQKVFSVSPEQFGLADFEVVGDSAMGLYGDPDPATTEFDWDANPVAGDFGVAPLDPNEVFSDGERIFSLRLDALVKPLCLLLVRGVEFNAGVALQESLEPFVFVVEHLALDIGQPHDFRFDSLLYFHCEHQCHSATFV